jgi:hypothetical protein
MTDKYFDINKFPKEWGIIALPISMSRIGNAQSPQECFDVLSYFQSKITVNQVGANFIYSEGLYMNFETDAYKTKNNFATTMVSHMLGVKNLVSKNYQKFQIDSAFHFESWFQMYLSHKDFFKVLKTVKDLYENDAEFRKQVALDAKEQMKELTERQIAFYLEEHAFGYLLINRKLSLSNDFVNGREQWILFVYPGNPPRGLIYLFQKDPLGINDDSNPYKGQYNWVTKKFIPFSEVDLTNPRF